MNELTVEYLIMEIRKLLQQYRVRYWTEYFGQMEQQLELARLNKQDWRRNELLQELTELYGGMGSFNDYVITSMHGDMISRSNEIRVNARLNDLRHQLAETIREELKKLEMD